MTGEKFALEPVGPEEKKGWISLAFVQTGIIVCVPSLLLENKGRGSW